MKQHFIYDTPQYQLALEGKHPSRLTFYADGLPAASVHLHLDVDTHPAQMADLFQALMQYVEQIPVGESIDLVAACNCSIICNDDYQMALSTDAAYSFILALASLGLCSMEVSAFCFVMSERYHRMVAGLPAAA